VDCCCWISFGGGGGGCGCGCGGSASFVWMIVTNDSCLNDLPQKIAVFFVVGSVVV